MEGDEAIGGVPFGVGEPFAFVATGGVAITAQDGPIVIVVTIAGGTTVRAAIAGSGATMGRCPMCGFATTHMEGDALGCVAEPIGPGCAIGDAVIVAACITITR